MHNNYNLTDYNENDKKVLQNTFLTEAEKKFINDTKTKFEARAFCSILEDITKFYKNGYSTSKLAQIYNVSTRQIQRIFKDINIRKMITPIVDIDDNIQNSSSSPYSFEMNDYSLLPERLKEFLNYSSTIRGKSSNTVDAYKIDLTLFFKFLKIYRGMCPANINFDLIVIKDIDDTLISTIKLTDLYSFITFVEKHRNNSAYARARKVAALKSFFKYLYSKTRILYENPAADLETPKLSKRNPIYLTLNESKVLLNSIDETKNHSKRDYCIVTLFLNCGLRLSELCSIDISKIKDDTLTIVGKGNKERTVYLNKACINSIFEYMSERNSMKILDGYKDALFISERKTRIHKRTVENIVKKYIGASGLDKSKYSPHKLRHTAATLMYKYGNVDIRSLQKILGHENISTTQIYTHVDDERLREAVSSNPLNE